MPPSSSSSPPSKKMFRDFHWVETDEPHATRRKLILAKHPEIASLFGREWKTFPMVILLISIQFYIGFFVAPHVASWQFFLIAYIVGGTINHSLQLLVHDLSHNLCFETPILNNFLGMVANLPTGVPSASTFQKYHMEHHLYQGVDTYDVDIPSVEEVNLFRNNTLLKLIWVILQPFFYAIRPLLIKPRTPGKLELVNYAVQITFDVFAFVVGGGSTLLYFIASSLLGTGLHPAAGHFIAEHYEFVRGAETYSYYGPLNYVNFNVGYHNEHHDFPKVAWSNLPKVKAMAPEFYDNLPHHTSYLKVIYNYITDPSIGPFSRVKRPLRNNDKA